MLRQGGEVILTAWHFAIRELKERYAGTQIGFFWLLLSPLVMIVIYTVVFSDMMMIKLGKIQHDYAYSLYLIPGILTWSYFAALVNGLSTVAIDKSNLIKKIGAPLYLYHLALFFRESIIYVVSMTLGLIFYLLIGQNCGMDCFVLPVYMLLVGLFGFGIGIILSMLLPFFRDLKEMIGVVLQLWFWLTPIVYPKELLLKKLPWLVEINPMVQFITPLQHFFLHAKVTSLSNMALPFFLSIGVLFFAFYIYRLTLGAVRDVI